jgi:hypothetical protein
MVYDILPNEGKGEAINMQYLVQMKLDGIVDNFVASTDWPLIEQARMCGSRLRKSRLRHC